MWVGRAVVGLAKILVGLTAWFVLRLPIWVAGSERKVVTTQRLESHLGAALSRENATLPGVRVLVSGALEVVVAWRGDVVTPVLAGRLSTSVHEALDYPVRVHLVVLEVSQIQESAH